MSLPQDRAANRERKAAAIFGTKRVVRKKGDGRLPDNEPFQIESGEFVQIEVKNGMRRVPKAIMKAIEQARSYTPDAVAVAVFSDVGGAEFACLSAKTLARWIGVLPEKLLPPPKKKRRPKRPFKQLDLFSNGDDAPSQHSAEEGSDCSDRPLLGQEPLPLQQPP